MNKTQLILIAISAAINRICNILEFSNYNIMYSLKAIFWKGKEVIPCQTVISSNG